MMPERFGHELRQLWANSCGLRFVQHADFDQTAPEVFQFSTSGLRGIIRDLKQWLKFREGQHA